jgi:hypothetical protein
MISCDRHHQKKNHNCELYANAAAAASSSGFVCVIGGAGLLIEQLRYGERRIAFSQKLPNVREELLFTKLFT